jgi:hypothetical protein
MTLTEFLLARIAEDEATAQMVSRDSIGYTIDTDGPIETWWLSATRRGVPIMQMDVTRALAECEAKRRIVASCEEGCECHASGTTMGQTDWDVTILRALALPYAGHPGYLQEWRL